MHGLPASSCKYGSKPLHWPPSFHLSCWLQVLAQGPRQSDTCPYEALKILRGGNFYLSVPIASPRWSKRSAIVIVDQKGQDPQYSQGGKSQKNTLDDEPKRNGNHTSILYILVPQCTMCCLYSMFFFQPNKLRHILKFMSWCTIYHILSQLVRLEGKHDFRWKRDFQTLNLSFLGYFDPIWVFQK